MPQLKGQAFFKVFLYVLSRETVLIYIIPTEISCSLLTLCCDFLNVTNLVVENISICKYSNASKMYFHVY